eukprot:357433-Chlamydomonas_euryale.AAC.5
MEGGQVWPGVNNPQQRQLLHRHAVQPARRPACKSSGSGKKAWRARVAAAVQPGRGGGRAEERRVHEAGQLMLNSAMQETWNMKLGIPS